MARVARPRIRKDEDRLLDHWRIVEVRDKVMSVTYSLMVDDHYTKEEAARELANISTTLFYVEKERMDLENLLDNALAANDENIRSLKRKDAPKDTGA